jgi:hypothetical protein
MTDVVAMAVAVALDTVDAPGVSFTLGIESGGKEGNGVVGAEIEIVEVS